MRNRFIIKDILAPLRRLLGKLSERDVMIILSLFVGICCGLAAVLLKLSIEYIHHSLTSWFDHEAYNFLFLIYPGIGMLIAMLFVRYIVKDNIGHGVTKVLVAVSKNDSKIKRHNMWSSMLASSVTIGFGGSVGAEAPIVYTGAAIGSNVARYMGLSYKNMTILLGCGAAGAVAGIFKAPLAGVLFTLEILLFNISMSSILPLLLSTISATVISYIFLGDKPPFECTISPFALENLLVTRHMVAEAPQQFADFAPVAALATGVVGQTGIETLELIAAGKIDTTPLITHRFKLKDIEEAYQIFENRLDNVIKISIAP